ncbi:hypothetical protein SAMN06272765_3341 [Streptomyces sp. Ag109_G2-15]|nr:hypothetical protein SAMN06272765_3341 [Streptomyces sp. Ag109_G2-15]
MLSTDGDRRIAVRWYWKFGLFWQPRAYPKPTTATVIARTVL